jgi:hypothetical protein
MSYPSFTTEIPPNLKMELHNHPMYVAHARGLKEPHHANSSLYRTPGTECWGYIIQDLSITVAKCKFKT